MTEFGTEGVREPSRGERARSASADVRVAGSPSGEVGADIAARDSEYATVRERLEAVLHHLDCLHVAEDIDAGDYFRVERAKALIREALRDV